MADVVDGSVIAGEEEMVLNATVEALCWCLVREQLDLCAATRTRLATILQGERYGSRIYRSSSRHAPPLLFGHNKFTLLAYTWMLTTVKSG